MAIQVLKKVIDGKEYAVTQFGGRAAFILKARLIKVLGPAISTGLAGLFGAGTGKGGIDLNIESIGLAIEKIGLSPEEFYKLALELMEFTQCENKPIDAAFFDREFAGDTQIVYQILWFVLEANFGNFFGKNGIGARLKSLIPTEKLPV